MYKILAAPMTTKTTPPTTRATTKIKQQQKQQSNIKSWTATDIFAQTLRGINSKNTYILRQNTYITGAFKIRHGVTNFGVNLRVRNPKNENST